MLEETGTKVSKSTVKQVLYRHNLKDRSARKKPLLQNRHKKTDYGLKLHMVSHPGQSILCLSLFIWSGQGVAWVFVCGVYVWGL